MGFCPCARQAMGSLHISGPATGPSGSRAGAVGEERDVELATALSQVDALTAELASVRAALAAVTVER